ncbi:hypothetical protein Daus18300_006742 [Diaporthe australafricana]|uniref:2EXR domain-containing protein n=1 Tax=Diaporthe australafricana TaxID=127596 RepID=A0ABR3WS58_9PEZI
MPPSTSVNLVRIPGPKEQPKAFSTDKPGLSSSALAILGNQFEMSMRSIQENRRASPSFKLRHWNNEPKLSMSPSLNLKEQPKAAADASQHQMSTNVEFNTLPAELRVNIYKMTWEPRHVIISRHWHRETDDSSEEDHATTMTTSSAQLPVTLWISSESRHETLRHYQIAFACPKNGSSHVYFNFGVDELEVPLHTQLLRVISREELAKVKALIIPGSRNEALPPRDWTEGMTPEDVLDILGGMLSHIHDLDGKLHQLHIAGLSSGLEPQNPGNPLKDAELRRLAKHMQQEIAQGLDLPQTLSLIYERSLTTNASGQHLGLAQLVLSLGGFYTPALGKNREMRIGEVRVAWHACDDTTASDTDDKGRTLRTVVEWDRFAFEVSDILSNDESDDLVYEI